MTMSMGKYVDALMAHQNNKLRISVLKVFTSVIAFHNTQSLRHCKIKQVPSRCNVPLKPLGSKQRTRDIIRLCKDKHLHFHLSPSTISNKHDGILDSQPSKISLP
ncbi:hypothetical protein Ahy_B05g078063 isoform B [Arachis hypogaea]|uniref:Uncharacterized protein n=1 Tax=Arachis hypogaea TaxID=3818 RepID=A0A444Z683_ARAHY|nr:hypothetical protein Ahy_B05g078063 isoform B [Arachis hypogaea]